jgi:Fur family ferric uptake transcriptional regulator
MRQAYTLVKDAGLKLTPRRRAIIALFSDVSGPLSPLEVLERLKLQFSRCGLPGVYRNLESLADCGVLFRIAGFSRERRYALCGKHGHEEYHHHHIICTSCGRVGEVKACGYHEGMVIDGFRLESHLVELRGICTSCSLRESEVSE